VKDARVDFLDRVRELTSYIHHVCSASQGGEQSVDARTSMALRATAYLVTYNLVEATARNAVRAVFDQLAAESVSFDDVRIELKKLLLAHARRRKSDDLALQFADIAKDIVTSVFDPSELFSGNVDAKELKHTAKQLGYKPNNSKEMVREALLIVKTNRNDLAHGNKTFAEIGRDVTIQDLRNHAARAIVYMRQVLRNVDEYLENREYLARRAG